MNDNYQLADSVRQYFKDPALQAGVDSIAAAGKLPVDLRSPELVTFYEAWWSTQQVQAEYALDMARLWQMIWGVASVGDLLDPGPSKAEDRDEGDLHPVKVWENEQFLRYDQDTENSYWVNLTAAGLSCGCWRSNGHFPAGLELDDDGLFNSEPITVNEDGTIKLQSLQSIAAKICRPN